MGAFHVRLPRAILPGFPPLPGGLDEGTVSMTLRRHLAPALVATLLAATASAAPLVVGHRGTGSSNDSNPYPENSLPSVRRAFREGADLVEIDVQLARGGEVILWHDEMVPVGGEKRRTVELLPSEFPPIHGTVVSATVPRFRDVVRLALAEGGPGKVLDVEVKIYRDQDRAPLAAAIAQVLREERAAQRVLVASFDKGVLRLLERALPGLESGLLGVFRFSTLRAAKKMIEEGTEVEWVLPSQWAPFAQPGNTLGTSAERAEEARLLEQEEAPSSASFVRKAHRAGLRAGLWTVDSSSKMRELVADGYDCFITNEPNLGRAVVDSAR